MVGWIQIEGAILLKVVNSTDNSIAMRIVGGGCDGCSGGDNTKVFLSSPRWWFAASAKTSSRLLVSLSTQAAHTAMRRGKDGVEVAVVGRKRHGLGLRPGLRGRL